MSKLREENHCWARHHFIFSYTNDQSIKSCPIRRSRSPEMDVASYWRIIMTAIHVHPIGNIVLYSTRVAGHYCVCRVLRKRIAYTVINMSCQRDAVRF